LGEDSRRRTLVRTIISNIEENKNSWVKALFYSDDDVSRIVERLVRAWSNNNMRGEPLEYATIEELEILAKKSEEYRDSPQEAFLRKMLRESTGVEEESS